MATKKKSNTKHCGDCSHRSVVGTKTRNSEANLYVCQNPQSPIYQGKVSEKTAACDQHETA